jgi:hypothetical protein
MTATEREAFITRFRAIRDHAMDTKGVEYAKGSGDDVEINANFKLVALLLKGAPVDPVTVAAVYWLKHVAAVCRFVVTRERGSEPLMGRLGDAANYIEIMASLMEEAGLI